jgi:hypothetical protein
MKTSVKNLLVIVFFVVLTGVMTYPQIVRMGSAVRDPGDPLLNTWILAWDVHKLTQFEFVDFFDANIFHPLKGTLAYSEHLFPQALVAAPTLLISGNPILAYNVVFLLAFVTSALGMYLFARYITGSLYGSVLAGIVFAFSPFMFNQLSHLQVLCAGGIPLTFLFLEMFLVARRWRDVLLFALVFTVQILANGYYALFLSLFVAIFIISELVRRKLFLVVEIWRKLAVAGLVSGVLSCPFLYQYIMFQNETGFSRSLPSYTSLASFISVNGINRVYGSITAGFSGGEMRFFPGIIALGLGVAGFIITRGYFHQKRKSSAPEKHPEPNISIGTILNVLLVFVLGVIVYILVSGPLDLTLHLRSSNVIRPLMLMVLLLVLKRVLVLRKFGVVAVDQGAKGFSVVSYLIIGVLAFFFTFGAEGPYIFFHKYVPGFDGIRAIGRVHIFVMFALAVFTAFGGQAIERMKRRWLRKAFMGVVPLFILVEYASFPLPLADVWGPNQVPGVYCWLGTNGNESDVVLELPLPPINRGIALIECPRVYASTYHWKRLVNGYSGFYPRIYNELRRRWESFPLEQNLEEARSLGVRYLVIHIKQRYAPDGQALASALLEFPNQVNLIKQYEGAWLFELVGWQNGLQTKSAQGLEVLPKGGWSATATVNVNTAMNALDGDMTTRWNSEPQKPGVAFELNLGRSEAVCGLRMKLGTSRNDYPRGYEIAVSSDGSKWEIVAKRPHVVFPITAILDTQMLAVDVFFPPQRARFLRITQTGRDKVFYWSIHEVEVFTRCIS